jgi:hypothetical protein
MAVISSEHDLRRLAQVSRVSAKQVISFTGDRAKTSVRDVFVE